jgi:two-component system cell cycle response regulator DivK
MKPSEANHKTILIVDDDALNLKLFSVILAARGYRVLQASDGPRGIDLANQERPDLVIMDVQLPGISGIEATQVLKRDCNTWAIPVIVATAFLIEEDELRESGCDACMTKPFASSEFIALIESFFERSTARQPVLNLDRPGRIAERLPHLLPNSAE